MIVKNIQGAKRQNFLDKDPKKIMNKLNNDEKKTAVMNPKYQTNLIDINTKQWYLQSKNDNLNCHQITRSKIEINEDKKVSANSKILKLYLAETNPKSRTTRINN